MRDRVRNEKGQALVFTVIFLAGLIGAAALTIDVGATAAARADVPNQVYGVAPIVVDKHHPYLSGPGCPCFDVPTTLCLGFDDEGRRRELQRQSGPGGRRQRQRPGCTSGLGARALVRQRHDRRLELERHGRRPRPPRRATAATATTTGTATAAAMGTARATETGTGTGTSPA